MGSRSRGQTRTPTICAAWRDRAGNAGLALDGAGWLVSDELIVPDNVSLVELPLHAHELNLIENVWARLRGSKWGHRLFNGYKDMIDACCDAWNMSAVDETTARSITPAKGQRITPTVENVDTSSPGHAARAAAAFAVASGQSI